MQHTERKTLIRDMPNGSRIVAKLEIRHPSTDGTGLSPGFSLTGEVYEKHGTWSGAAQHRNGREADGGGCVHAEILRAFPKLATFAAVHLADLDGTPMHALANASYFYYGLHYGPDCYRYDSETNPARAAEYLRVPSKRVPPALELCAFRAMVEDLREGWRHDAADARRIFDNLSEIYPKAAEKAREAARSYAVDLEWSENQTDSVVSRILRRDNPNDPSGQWSVFDIAREMTGKDLPSIIDMEIVRVSLRHICPNGGRYVGGTSGYLYSLPYAESAA